MLPGTGDVHAQSWKAETASRNSCKVSYCKREREKTRCTFYSPLIMKFKTNIDARIREAELALGEQKFDEEIE